MRFFPLESLSNLIVEPITKLNAIQNIGKQIGLENLKDYDVHLLDVAIVLCWIAIFVFLSYKLLQKRDL
jgi:hypothetical protein